MRLYLRKLLLVICVIFQANADEAGGTISSQQTTNLVPSTISLVESIWALGVGDQTKSNSAVLFLQQHASSALTNVGYWRKGLAGLEGVGQTNLIAALEYLVSDLRATGETQPVDLNSQSDYLRYWIAEARIKQPTFRLAVAGVINGYQRPAFVSTNAWQSLKSMLETAGSKEKFFEQLKFSQALRNQLQNPCPEEVWRGECGTAFRNQIWVMTRLQQVEGAELVRRHPILGRAFRSGRPHPPSCLCATMF